ncbi:LacI family DNA-binding transcriptional regulator [Jonesiaceae bacterium BS-20]|uniref:LacI family DNA-binding transcriptional regulator n=1 Tax=Jonesiaceae bacterium BS-20 TaxID=3120821 RepID=A0AAU7DRW1_9MICO
MSTTKPTLSDVATHAKVSLSTASLAFKESGPIADSTRNRVLAAAEELGYPGPSALGRQLRSGRSGIVGVVLDAALRMSFRDPVSISVLDGIARGLGEHGIGVLMIPGAKNPNDPHTINPLIESAAFDAAILTWGGQPGDPTYELLNKMQIPMVFAEGRKAGTTPLVNIDDRAGTKVLTEYLVGLGHTRIAVVTLNLNTGNSPGPMSDDLDDSHWMPSHDRLRGVYDAGVTPVTVWEASGSLIEEGQLAARTILDPAHYGSPDLVPTAVIAQSDLLAIGVLQEARAMGLEVPQDLSVAGFDGINLAWLGQDVLTTVRQPLEQRGMILAQTVLELLDAGTAPDVILPSELYIGTTTAPPAR